ncbi:MAG: hypothetical protein R3A12_15500 [Ignavibacteria bacterium]
MKRVNLLTKYSVLFFTIFLLLFVFLSQVIDVSNETLITVSLISIFFFIFSIIFIFTNKYSLKSFFAFSDKLKLRNVIMMTLIILKKKISEINTILDQLSDLRSRIYDQQGNVSDHR